MYNGKPLKLSTAKGTDAATKRDRGKLRFQKAPEGQADFVEVCIRDADGSYVWQRLVTLAYVLRIEVGPGTAILEHVALTQAPLVETPAPVESTTATTSVTTTQAETPATQVVDRPGLP